METGEEKLSRLLKRGPNDRLEFNGYSFPPEAVACLTVYIRANPELRVLRFDACELDSATVITILTAAADCVNLECISFEANKIDDSGIAPILGRLGNLPTLTELNLSANPVTDNGAEHIATFLRNTQSVQTLRLEKLNLTERGIRLIAEAVPQNRSVRDLHFQQYFMGIFAREHLVDMCTTRPELELHGVFTYRTRSPATLAR